jgi:hypothetical protein
MYSVSGSRWDTDHLHPPVETSFESILSSFTQEQT